MRGPGARATSERSTSPRSRSVERSDERHADTVGPYLDGWPAGRAVAGLRPATIHNYRASLERHVIPGLGRRKIQSLRTADFNRLYKDMMEGVDGRPPVSAAPRGWRTRSSARHSTTLAGKG